MENLSRVFKNKKEEQTHEEIEFHYFIQDCVSTTVYQLHKSAWKNAWGGCFKKGGAGTTLPTMIIGVDF